MTQTPRRPGPAISGIKSGPASMGAMTRRLALLSVGAAALGGCSWVDDLLTSDKEKLPGRRQAVIVPRRGLEPGSVTATKVVLPPPVSNADWKLAGGVPSHNGGHPALADKVARAWSGSIGEGGGYRQKITAPPVIAGGRVYTMDSDANVTGFDATTGNRLWRTTTQADDDRSTNIGGGIAIDGDIVYAATGRADLLGLDAATGAIKWRAKLPSAARSAPTIAEGKVFLTTLDSQVLGLSATDGKKIWSYQSVAPETTVLGLPAPAYADGILVAGFGSGDVLALRASNGSVVWGESLASARGRTSVSDLSSVRGRAVISGGRVYAIGLGQLMLAIDLRSGRRLWEREVGSTETPWLAGDWLFVLSNDAQLAAINTADGSLAWVHELDRYEDEAKQRDPIHWVGPILAGDRLVVGNSLGSAVSISPYTGAVLGTQKLSDALSLPPVVAANTLFVVTDDGTLTAFR
jgi:outer membrane protein assembly factor BamB